MMRCVRSYGGVDHQGTTRDACMIFVTKIPTLCRINLAKKNVLTVLILLRALCDDEQDK
jgi:hypothetical protein